MPNGLPSKEIKLSGTVPNAITATTDPAVHVDALWSDNSEDTYISSIF
jgi:hypothetical protein